MAHIGSIIETTRKTFRKKTADMKMTEVSRSSGIPRTWLIAFRDNKIKEPFGSRIAELQKFLATI